MLGRMKMNEILLFLIGTPVAIVAIIIIVGLISVISEDPFFGSLFFLFLPCLALGPFGLIVGFWLALIYLLIYKSILFLQEGV